MKIIVYGLGIIGASICASLKKAGHNIMGKNRSKPAVEYALTHGYIDGEAQSFNGADVVILALPPRACINVLDRESFPDGCIVTDICGVKTSIEKIVYAKKRNYRYVGMHPMAGKETSGIASACVDLFQNKNLILTRRRETDENALSAIRQLGADMGFSRIVVCSAEEHDKIIALTSQLAHVVSNAYVKSPLTAECLGFTGGSFQDMTRIAGVDENVWTELFFLNSENLTAEIKRLCTKLTEYATSLEANDEERMKKLLTEGKRSFAQFEKSK